MLRTIALQAHLSAQSPADGAVLSCVTFRKWALAARCVTGVGF